MPAVAIVVVDASGLIHSNPRAREQIDRQLGCEVSADLDSAINIFHPDGRGF